MRYRELINKASIQIKNITRSPKYESEILLLHILKKDRIWLHLNIDKTVSKDIQSSFFDLIKLRENGKPIEYITNIVSFYSEDFYACEDVLIARPETEILVDVAVDEIKNIYNPKVVEVGVGSGIVSIMLTKIVKGLNITALDISQKALECSKKNAIKHNLYDKIELIESDLLNSVKDRKFDILISNPPYISEDEILEKSLYFEPKNALFAGSDGGDIFRRLFKEAFEMNIKILICEMGYDQRDLITKLVDNIEIESLTFYKDLAGLDRGFILKVN